MELLNTEASILCAFYSLLLSVNSSLQGDLHYVSFPVLKGCQCSDYLCKRFSLLVVPSISALKESRFIHVETHYIINLYRISYYRGGQAKDSCIRPRTHRLINFQVNQRTKVRPCSEQTSALVLGNPKLPSTVSILGVGGGHRRRDAADQAPHAGPSHQRPGRQDDVAGVCSCGRLLF